LSSLATADPATSRAWRASSGPMPSRSSANIRSTPFFWLTVIATLTGSLWVEQSSFPQARVQCGGPQGHLFMVADGMGGHAGGEHASVLAVEAIESFMLSALGWLYRLEGHDAAVLDELRSALSQADAAVTAEAKAHPEISKMGTTLTIACSIEDVLYVAHAGDTRCYLRRDGKLHQLTHDHTVVGELVDAGVIGEEAARHHDLRHMVTNVIGGGSDGVVTEVHKLRLLADDVILLSSDGLTDAVSVDRIEAILDSRKDPRSACARLVAAANLPDQDLVDGLSGESESVADGLARHRQLWPLRAGITRSR